jgi:hypothetical protein
MSTFTGTKFTPAEMTELLSSVDQLPDDPDIDTADIVATIFRLLAAGWTITVPSTQSQENS